MTTFASPVDTDTYGEYAITRRPDDDRPLYRFTGRISDDDSTPYPAEAGRYHVYAGLFCPWAQRVTLTVELAGLRDSVSVSYVDNARDGRGWAFREAIGPDPVNDFALLRDAYEATEPGFDGHISVPTLWDRTSGRVISNDFATIDRDLASRTAGIAGPDRIELYPAEKRAEIDRLEEWLRPTVNSTVGSATGSGPDAAQASATLQTALAALDERLTGSRFLIDDQVTLADVRLWVSLVRYDAAAARSGAPRLAEHPHVWRYARELYALPAFAGTTDFPSFGGTDAVAEDWRSGAEHGVPA
ncbi:glutathione S-transferase C-terminal domain-containing protein [Gordonia soli]|uniref:GST C-terminal domain-containing protein n=1 Tax=Gordonia soli NBRC 108243 TaxID=1223545 RepID=M0QHD3_9ACTN|nr:glutathione S-transferase C-terminal domain-containing protein [Gordonia soli]GAC67948.1 hypothetical protein GS4_11_02170 [Gordonia soli NBRC 108243]